MSNGFKRVNDLPGTAVAVIAVAIVLAASTVILAEFQDSGVNFDELVTTDEYDQPTATNGINSSSGFQQLTLDNKGPEDLVSVGPVKFSDVSGGTNTTLTEGDNYTVDLTADTNQVNVTDVDAYDSSTGDAFFTTYTNSTRRGSYGILDSGVGAFQTFSDFLTLIVILVVAVILFTLLSVLRNGSRSATV